MFRFGYFNTKKWRYLIFGIYPIIPNMSNDPCPISYYDIYICMNHRYCILEEFLRKNSSQGYCVQTALNWTNSALSSQLTIWRQLCVCFESKVSCSKLADKPDEYSLLLHSLIWIVRARNIYLTARSLN